MRDSEEQNVPVLEFLSKIEKSAIIYKQFILKKI